MTWEKQGWIYTTEKEFSWNRSHAQVPFVHPIGDMRWRIYFGTRDEKNRTFTTFIDVQAGNPKNILYRHSTPILQLGRMGTFDDCGVMPSWIIDFGGLTYLYYIGWTVRNTIPYHNSIGLALSKDNGVTFKRYSQGPLYSPTVLEPYFTGTSCIIIDNGIWKNWYLSCTKWEILNGKPEPFYHIKYAESPDGIQWKRDGHIAIDFKSPDEGGIVRASVMKEDQMYKMWYSFRKARDYRTNRKNSYRIGYAESKDGRQWHRKDRKITIELSETGWDSEMMAYPHVIKHNGTRYMFYNGNGFGRTGFGYAIEVE